MYKCPEQVKLPVYPHTCLTCAELPSNKSTVVKLSLPELFILESQDIISTKHSLRHPLERKTRQNCISQKLQFFFAVCKAVKNCSAVIGQVFFPSILSYLCVVFYFTRLRIRFRSNFGRIQIWTLKMLRWKDERQRSTLSGRIHIRFYRAGTG